MTSRRLVAAAVAALVSVHARSETIIQPIQSAPIVWDGPAFVLHPIPGSPATITASMSWFVHFMIELDGEPGVEFASIQPHNLPSCCVGVFSPGGANLPDGTLIDAALPERAHPKFGAWSSNAIWWASGPLAGPTAVAFRVTTDDGIHFGWLSFQVEPSRGFPAISVTPIEVGFESTSDVPTLLGFVDCNGNGVNDPNETNSGAKDDCNHDLLPDECQPADDCDGNGVVDLCDIGADATVDLDNDLVLDSCEIAADPTLDCDDDGLLDAWEITHGGGADCNGNDVLDACDIALDPGLDCDGDGTIDWCGLCVECSKDYDCNNNGLLDLCEIAADPSLDCDVNGALDACEPWTDCSGDGIPDACQPPVDFNNNGVNDYCENLGDQDGDGTVGASDLAVILAMWGSACPCSGDLNNDAAVDALDLAIVLSLWSAP